MQVQISNPFLREVTNVPFMAPALLVTYAAAFGQMLNAMPGPTYFYFEPKSNRDKRAR